MMQRCTGASCNSNNREHEFDEHNGINMRVPGIQGLAPPGYNLPLPGCSAELAGTLETLPRANAGRRHMECACYYRSRAKPAGA
jgi:hypothetical protein